MARSYNDHNTGHRSLDEQITIAEANWQMSQKPTQQLSKTHIKIFPSLHFLNLGNPGFKQSQVDWPKIQLHLIQADWPIPIFACDQTWRGWGLTNTVLPPLTFFCFCLHLLKNINLIIEQLSCFVKSTVCHAQNRHRQIVSFRYFYKNLNFNW